MAHELLGRSTIQKQLKNYDLYHNSNRSIPTFKANTL